MNGAPIDEVFVGVIVDDDGTEGVPAITVSDGTTVPAFTARRPTLEPLRLLMKDLANLSHKTVTMTRFTKREDFETIEPDGPLGPIHEDFKAEPEPRPVSMDPDIVICETVVVVGLEVGGQPAFHLGMTLQIGSERVQLPVLFAGPIATDLHKLINQGWTVMQARGN